MDSPPAWHPDPLGRHELRFWDGSVWTEHVANRGVQAIDADPVPASDIRDRLAPVLGVSSPATFTRESFTAALPWNRSPEERLARRQAKAEQERDRRQRLEAQHAQFHEEQAVRIEVDRQIAAAARAGQRRISREAVEQRVREDRLIEEAKRRRKEQKRAADLAAAKLIVHGGDAVVAGRPQIPREVRLAVFERDGGQCVECGSRFDIQYDHIIPFAMGGSSTVENLQILCAPCNQRKGASLG